MKGRRLSDKTKEKLRLINTGKQLSDEHKKKISLAHKGKRLSEETKQKIRLARKGKPLAEQHKRNVSLALKGRKHSESHIEKVRIAQKGKPQHRFRGQNHWNWQGGITPINLRIRNSIEYELWRGSVFVRDSWTCQDCRQRGGRLHAHHIKAFAKYPELRCAIDNGITLCLGCHKRFHRRMRKGGCKDAISNY